MSIKLKSTVFCAAVIFSVFSLIFPNKVSAEETGPYILPKKNYGLNWREGLNSYAPCAGQDWRVTHEYFSDPFYIDGIVSFYAKASSNGTSYSPGAMGRVDLIDPDGTVYNIVYSNMSSSTSGTLYTKNVTVKPGKYKIRWQVRHQDGECNTSDSAQESYRADGNPMYGSLYLGSWAYGYVTPVYVKKSPYPRFSNS